MNAPRSYDQYCGLARSLDVVGDRWNLLVVRELLPGPRRFRDLASALPGIASNLLTDRLRRLEAAGVVERVLDDGAAAYALTPWGSELRGPIEGLVRWSTPLMVSGPRPTDTFEPRWLSVALPAVLAGRGARSDAVVGVEVDRVLIAVRVSGGVPTVDLDPVARPDHVVAGPASLVLGLAVGLVPLDHPDLRIEGDARVVADVFGASVA